MITLNDLNTHLHRERFSSPPKVYKFCIPFMTIQGKLLEMENSKEIIQLKTFIVCWMNEAGIDLDDEVLDITYDLENQWFPIVCTDDRYLAQAIIKYCSFAFEISPRAAHIINKAYKRSMGRDCLCCDCADV